MLFDALSRYAVEGPHYFDDDAYTDMPEKELVAEVIREKALLFMRDEIPHGIAVVVERFKERPDTDLIDIDVNIYCERESHKGMVIGKGGAMLKKIASAARADCEEFLGCRVNLQCWVKVKGCSVQRLRSHPAPASGLSVSDPIPYSGSPSGPDPWLQRVPFSLSSAVASSGCFCL